MGFFATVNDGVYQLILGQMDLFHGMGMNLFRAFAGIIIAWFGIQVALEGNGMPFGKFASLVQRLAFCYAMVAFYDTPIPGIGISFVHLFTDQAKWMVDALSSSTIQELMDYLNEILNRIEFPSWYEASAIFQVISIEALLVIAEGVIFVSIAYGYVAMAIAILLGPMFVPFFIVPEMEWLFWGWFRALFQYSLYPVVGAAHNYVWAYVILKFIRSLPQPITADTITTHFVPFAVLMFAFIYSSVKMHSLVHSLVSGHAGDSVIPRAWRN